MGCSRHPEAPECSLLFNLCKGYPGKDIDFQLRQASTARKAVASLGAGRAARGKQRRSPIGAGICPCMCSSPVSRTCSKAQSSSEQWDNFLSLTEQQTSYFFFFSEAGKAWKISRQMPGKRTNN